ncbi:hypothetical protein BDD12DRAFT_808190 [Trichophaea hybrida]|nr:hypothetical protein BDD12DRAFT_808190 [Trichophaea hybrida]
MHGGAEFRDRDLWRLQHSMHGLHLREDKTNGVPPILYRAYDDVSASQWKPDYGFSSTKTMGDVSNDEKWEHLTTIHTMTAGSKAFEGTSMISTSESAGWIKAMCIKRMDGGCPEGYVTEIDTKRIRTPIRRALTEVLGFAELEHRQGAGKVLQQIGTEWGATITIRNWYKKGGKSREETPSPDHPQRQSVEQSFIPKPPEKLRMQPKRTLVCYSNKPTKITYEIIDNNGTVKKTIEYCTEYGGLEPQYTTASGGSQCPPQADQRLQHPAQDRATTNGGSLRPIGPTGPQYEEMSEDERETEHGPPKRWTTRKTRTTGSTSHPATRRGRNDELKKLGSPIRFTTRIGCNSTPGRGLPSALTSIAHTTEVWEQLPFFRNGARRTSPPSSPSQDRTQHLRFQWSPGPIEETGTPTGSAEMRNPTQGSSGNRERLGAEERTGEGKTSQQENSAPHPTDPDWMASRCKWELVVEDTSKVTRAEIAWNKKESTVEDDIRNNDAPTKKAEATPFVTAIPWDTPTWIPVVGLAFIVGAVQRLRQSWGYAAMPADAKAVVEGLATTLDTCHTNMEGHRREITEKQNNTTN